MAADISKKYKNTTTTIVDSYNPGNVYFVDSSYHNPHSYYNEKNEDSIKKAMEDKKKQIENSYLNKKGVDIAQPQVDKNTSLKTKLQALFKPLGLFQPINKREKELSANIFAFIEQGFLDKVLEMVSHGYVLNQKMESFLKSKMQEASQNNNLELFEKILSKNLYIESYYIYPLLFKKGNFLAMLYNDLPNNKEIFSKYKNIYKEDTYPETSDDNDIFMMRRLLIMSSYGEFDRTYITRNSINNIQKKYPHLSEFIIDSFKTKNFRRQLFLHWQHKAFAQRNKVNMLLWTNNLPSFSTTNLITQKTFLEKSWVEISHKIIFAEATLEEYLAIMQSIKISYSKKSETHDLYPIYGDKNKIYKKYYDSMKESFEELYHSDIGSIEKEATQSSDILLDKKLDQDIAGIQETTNTTELPEVALGVIETIKTNYNKIKVNSDYTTDVVRHDVENMMNKRIVEIIYKYCHMDHEYKNSITNLDGKTAETLLIESLTNISDTFTHLLENINAAKLSSLSATQRYTQHFKDSHIQPQLSKDNADIDSNLNEMEAGSRLK